MFYWLGKWIVKYLYLVDNLYKNRIVKDIIYVSLYGNLECIILVVIFGVWVISIFDIDVCMFFLFLCNVWYLDIMIKENIGFSLVKCMK